MFHKRVLKNTISFKIFSLLPVNMKKSEKKLILAEIKEKTRRCLESRKNANDLVSIISFLQVRFLKTRFS